jgi:hypothetical protein
VLERTIPGSPDVDAIGCYPLFACEDWSRLPEDLEERRRDWVTLSLVADPFGNYDLDDLRRCFDVVVPSKERFVIETGAPPETAASAHHRYYARKALKSVEVHTCANPSTYLDEWVALYQQTAEKYELTGIQAFSRSSFEQQLRIPGLVLFRSTRHDATIGLDMWFVMGRVAYRHLAGYSPAAYTLNAQYAVMWHAMHYFAGRVQCMDIGGAAGVTDNGPGLRFFKRGWATGTRQTYFCGRVFDAGRYAALAAARDTVITSFFPAYRFGEFGSAR